MNEKLNLTPLRTSLRSVAVLPFVNMSSDPEQEYFSDGLSEELLNRLAQNNQLHVAARTSSFQFKGKNLDIGDIGRQLKVENILEGSVRKSVNLDPTFSKAWSGLAFNYSLLPSYGTTVSPQEAWEKVKFAFDKAIGLDPANAEAFVAVARMDNQDSFKITLGLYEKAMELAPNNTDVFIIGDFGAAERLEKKAIELDPLAAVHYYDLASVIRPLGRVEESLEYGRTSARLEPDSASLADSVVQGLLASRLYDEAIETIRHFEQQAIPDNYYINSWWCLLYYQQGDEQKLREKVSAEIRALEAGQGQFDYSSAAFFMAWLDGTDAALPLLAKAYETDEYNLFWPAYFYLPEDISDDPDWLAFWQQPRLAELIDIRRSNKTQAHVGWWKERPKR